MQSHYIVVGAGSAGCIVARVLAEAGHSVLLIEPGASCSAPAMRRPARYPQLFGSAADWQFRSERQTQLCGRALPQPRGRGPGGSTLLNAMIWMRPRPGDLEALHCAAGPLWSAAALLPSLEAVEAWIRPEAPRWLSASSHRFLAAAAELTELAEVCAHRRMNRRGVRTTAADVLNESAAAERVVRCRGLVERLEIRQRRIVGVHFQSASSRSEQASASHGVILCAGAFLSPTILMRSGIGPAALLRKCGIDVLEDRSAVGEALVDHLVMPVVFSTAEASPFRLPVTPRDVARWQHAGSGPLTSNLAEVGGFAQLPVASRGGSAEVQLHVTPTDYLRYPKAADHAAMTIAVTDCRPASRGRVTIGCRDPQAAPRIDPEYLSDTSDRDVLLAGVQLARRIAARPPLSQWCGEEHAPTGKRHSDEALSRSIARYAQTLYHPAGTCAVGASPHSVVETDLQLRGFERCWVIDASVLPILPAANPNATIMAIAHRFAQRLLSS